MEVFKLTIERKNIYSIELLLNLKRIKIILICFENLEITMVLVQLILVVSLFFERLIIKKKLNGL